MKNKMNLIIELDNEHVLYRSDMPEVLKKYFTNMETTIETMIELTNNGEFYDIRCEFDNTNNSYNFAFIGSELIVRITSPVKKETLIIKEEFCELRNKVYHSFIKAHNIKYIIKTKPYKLYTEHYKFFDENSLVLDLSIGYNNINVLEFCKFLYNEKLSLNNNFKFSNIKKYTKIEQVNIIEIRDVYGEIVSNNLKEFLKALEEAKKFDSVILDEEINLNAELDEIDDLMYQTGILSLSEIKEALENEELENNS